MAARSIEVQIVKETSTTVTVKLVSLNRSMPVPKEDFEKRVKQGLYRVTSPTGTSTNKEE